MKRYPHYIIEIARELRKKPTRAEKVLWQKLRNRKLGGLKFVRQHPIGRYVTDFYCHELGLVVELEGSIHENLDQRSYDADRFEEFENRGLKILRFKNEMIRENIEAVLERILAVKEKSRDE